MRIDRMGGLMVLPEAPILHSALECGAVPVTAVRRSGISVLEKREQGIVRRRREPNCVIRQDELVERSSAL